MRSFNKLMVIGFALTFYCLGTTFFEALVNYRTWPRIGAAEFRAYHQALTPLVVKVMLVPIALYLLVLVGLLLSSPLSVPRGALTVSLGLLLVAVASSLFIQIPLQRELERTGLSLPLISRLIQTDLWLRKLPLALNAILWLGLFWRRP